MNQLILFVWAIICLLTGNPRSGNETSLGIQSPLGRIPLWLTSSFFWSLRPVRSLSRG